MLITIPLRGIRERLEYVSLCHKEVHCIVGLVCIHLHSIFFVFAVFPLKINWLIVWNCLFPDDKLSEMLSFHSVILQNLCTVLRLTQICCSEKRLRPERGESVRSSLTSCVAALQPSFHNLKVGTCFFQIASGTHWSLMANPTKEQLKEQQANQQGPSLQPVVGCPSTCQHESRPYTLKQVKGGLHRPGHSQKQKSFLFQA